MEARYSAENQEEVTRNWGNIDLLKGLHQLRLTLLVVLFPRKEEVSLKLGRAWGQFTEEEGRRKSRNGFHIYRLFKPK